ncbi:hypothetical protein KK083_05175 [Fulvivirgaceae bacterium PWU4]|uniref:Uncharacterized protein n=1 Tax=Chryseosolibacter histidini TaxID=2782349 RepID=A0AAP2DHF5_9BACT|nr:hypothetical protein [Chryseosolibacter histidini]MBT1696255.1 hypothetical protein [Chryseosolibacter histidini]
MKKICSIFLVCLLLLNVLGYYGVFLGLKYRNTVDLTQRLDAEDYATAETVTIKVPLAIPYYMDTEFERIDGEIEHQGEYYRLVKQKLENDTLHIVCFRDVKGKRLKQALADYVKTFSHHSSNEQSLKTVPGFIKDYISANFTLASSAMGWNVSLNPEAVQLPLHLMSLPVVSPPPEA